MQTAAATAPNTPALRGSAAPATEGIPPRWTVLTITWINSLGSGILWSGVPFVTEGTFGFTKTQNLLLALAESVIYVVVALGSGPVLRRLGAATGLTPRGWLVGIFAIQLAAAFAALAGATGLVLSACALSGCGAALWPVMESYMSAGQHGHDMRRSIGWFNITWMSATAASLLLMAPISAAGHADWAMLTMVPVSAASIALLRWMPARPAAHAPEAAHRHIAPQYAYLLRATRFVVPTSYVFISALGPILPFMLRALALPDGWMTPLASCWMFARVVTVVGLSRATFWHGRWSTLAVAVVLLVGGFATIALAPSVPVLVAGLVAFGAGHGIIYYASLYYAMAVGGAEVDAGGFFEALIGIGYVVGPLAGFAGGASAGGLVAATCIAACAGLGPALGPWRAWRRHAAEARA